MPRFEVTGPDGKRYEVNAPEGASHDQAIAHVKSQYYAAEKKDPYTETAQNQSVLQNLLAGAGGGAMSLILGGKQLLGKATPEEIAEHKQAMKGLRSTTAGMIGDIGGQIAAALPTALIPGANTMTGAVLTGGGLGALQPTDESESRLANTIVGGLGGAAGKYVGDAIGNLVSKLSQRMNPGTVDIQGELAKRGIDYSKLNSDLQNSLKADVDDALKAGKQLDMDALSRKADFESLGMQPTLGQITRDPMQYQFERNTRGVVGSGESLSQRFNEQNDQLLAAMARARQATGASDADKFATGERLSQTLSGIDDAAKKNVGSLYDTARNAAGINTPLNPGNFAQSVNDALDQAMIGDALPAGVRKALNQIATGEMPFTIQKAEQLRQAINGQMPKIPDRTTMALRTVNDALQNEIDSVGSAVGGQAGGAFKAARGAAAQRFTELDKSPALKAATEGFEQADFVDKFIIRAKPSELMALRANLKDHPEVWNEARGQAIEFLKNKATGGQLDEFAKFSQAGYKNGLNSIGDARLKVLFSPDEIAELKRIQRVAAAVHVQPEGSAVNNSGTSQAVANLLSRLSGVPYLKEVVANPIMNFRLQGQVNNALNPNIQRAATPIPQPKPRSVFLPLLGGAAGANLQNY